MALTKLPKNALGTGSVDASKIEDGTIQTAELSGTIAADKLNATLNLSSKTVTLPNTSVTSDMLVNTTVANAKLSNSSITVRGTARNLGDTFTIGTDVDWQSVQTSGFTASTGRGYFVNTTSAAVTVTLPASASIGDTIAIKDYAGTFASNNLTIARNGHNIQGVANNSLISTNRASLVLVYVDVTKGWIFTDEHNVADLQVNSFVSATGGTIATSGDYKIHSFTGDGCFVVSTIGAGASGGPSIVDYVIVAGGGGGAGSGFGGGGSGGYRESHSTCNSGPYTASPLVTPTGITVSSTTYPITVGGGGSVGPTYFATPGSNSIFSTIASTGGGRGYEGNSADGGSGGGGGRDFPGVFGTGNTPPVSPPQGNNGGQGSGSPTYKGGGGGGAGGAGVLGPTNGNGGPGTTSSITASPITRAGGGGGGTVNFAPNPAGSGGSGGGGNGSSTTASGSNGTFNTGGGGGGGFYNQPGSPQIHYPGGSGGSGIVIIRYKYQ